MRFSEHQYDQAIEALGSAREQLVPDACCCRICHDTGHMAWECGHNPLRAAAICEDLSQQAELLHTRLHAIEDAMDSEDQAEAIALWREDVHDFLHYLAGHNIVMGHQVGPGNVVVPEVKA